MLIKEEQVTSPSPLARHESSAFGWSGAWVRSIKERSLARVGESQGQRHRPQPCADDLRPERRKQAETAPGPYFMLADEADSVMLALKTQAILPGALHGNQSNSPRQAD